MKWMPSFAYYKQSVQTMAKLTSELVILTSTLPAMLGWLWADH